VCLKWGQKYSSDYVNKLFAMTKRHCTVPHEFICFTENRKGIDKEIKTMPLPDINLDGWWHKTYFFSNDIPLEGTILYFDLDVIIFNNIDKLFDYKKERFCIIRDFNRSIRKDFDRVNSSVFRLQKGMFANIYDQFKHSPREHMQRNRGDQDWMYKNIKNFVYWPDDWIQSYKWEMRDRRDLQVYKGKRNFIVDAPPQIKPDCSVAVFHGEPNPADANDAWVKQHWG
tara:strand:+ start:5090 stop:5770 length:681 start_codon:yes stop_codon:yes gene_type:complete